MYAAPTHFIRTVQQLRGAVLRTAAAVADRADGTTGSTWEHVAVSDPAHFCGVHYARAVLQVCHLPVVFVLAVVSSPVLPNNCTNSAHSSIAGGTTSNGDPGRWSNANVPISWHFLILPFNFF